MKAATLSSSSSSTSTSISPVNQMAKKACLSPFLFTLLTFFIFIVILYGQDFSAPFDLNYHHPPPSFGVSPSTISTLFNSVDGRKTEKEEVSGGGGERREKAATPFAVGETAEECDIFKGRWVRDEKEKPMYQEWECPYIQPQVTCQEHGRPDRDYQFWRWQPHACHLPRFNATLMLEALRGKRMLFVGDSLNRGQYISMVCLVHRLVPEDGKSMESLYDSLTVFRLKDYNATIEFYWAPFLLESNSDDAVSPRMSDRIIRKGSINKHGKAWKGADIVVFDTYLWWITGYKMKILKGSFQDEVQEIEELITENAYRMAMKSLVKWVQKNMDPMKTRVFFTSMSPTHQK